MVVFLFVTVCLFVCLSVFLFAKLNNCAPWHVKGKKTLVNLIKSIYFITTAFVAGPARSEVERSLCKIVFSGDPSLNPRKRCQEFFAGEFSHKVQP